MEEMPSLGPFSRMCKSIFSPYRLFFDYILITINADQNRLFWVFFFVLVRVHLFRSNVKYSDT